MPGSYYYLTTDEIINDLLVTIIFMGHTLYTHTHTHTDEIPHTCPTTSITIPVSTTQAKEKNAATTGSFKSPPVGDDTGIIAGSVIGGIIAVLLLVAIILLVAVLIEWRHRKQHTTESNGRTYPNPVYDG